ncbi:MAG: NADH-quinone oxidoreductase subunit H, partial [Desulfobulbaceae bacterium]|nr:NADH-quinone oxidoreductase subunit H [Desulfobulbaceae bacterium]
IVTLFFGGFQIPWMSTAFMVEHTRLVVVLLMLLVPVFAYFFAGWIRKNNRSHFPRENDPDLVEAKWYIRVLWAAVILIELILLFFLIAGAGGAAARILAASLQITSFLVKVTFMCFVYVWVRWTLPRFRYDQLQKLGWQTLLPLSLLNILITSAVVVALS